MEGETGRVAVSHGYNDAPICLQGHVINTLRQTEGADASKLSLTIGWSGSSVGPDEGAVALGGGFFIGAGNRI